MTGDEYFHSRHFVPDVAALPGEPVVERDAPESYRRSSVARESARTQKAQRRRGNGIICACAAGPTTTDRGKST